MNRNTSVLNINDVTILKYPIFDGINFINHGASARAGGVSNGCFSSMNLGLGTKDSLDNVRKNWSIFCNAAGIDINSTVCAEQQHGDNIKIVTTDDCGKGIVKPRDYSNIDGLLTSDKGVTLCVFSADCIPVLFIDVKKRVIGAAHCGWRGTFKGLAGKMVKTMCEIYGSGPQNIKAAVGAGIHKCCYEVDNKLYCDFYEKFPCAENSFEIRENKYFIDLPGINKCVLKEAGLDESNIFVSEICTCCNKDRFFSHRGSRGRRGLMINYIGIID